MSSLAALAEQFDTAQGAQVGVEHDHPRREEVTAAGTDLVAQINAIMAGRAPEGISKESLAGIGASNTNAPVVGPHTANVIAERNGPSSTRQV